ncbi:hypothetical protein [Rhodospirillaceae bacterium SYSU D60014]|uniref:hypothetical protein n=1 Tax=Virgifigura deserti TaxID=2268457 RepID=UPI000E66D846
MADPELKDYDKRKQAERRRQEEPAKARKSADWNKKDHLDPARARSKPSDDEPKDAEGQAERGHIDQIITNKGYTQTR